MRKVFKNQRFMSRPSEALDRCSIKYLILISIFFFSSPTSAATRNWSVSSGNWDAPASWGGTVPSSTDTADINNMGTATVNTSGQVAGTLNLGQTTSGNSLNINSGGTLTISTGSNMATGTGSTGQAIIDAMSSSAATWHTGTGTFNVGESGNATLTIQNGGTVNSAGVSIAGNSTSTSTATISGSGSTWTATGKSYRTRKAGGLTVVSSPKGCHC